jgi:UDP-N-acetylmuramate--alanine ligase
MRSLAEVLWGWGWELSGSDLSAVDSDLFPWTGTSIHQGHAAEHLPADSELVVASDAVPADSGELCRARELGIPVQSYFQTVGQLMAARDGLAVAGTHGKSTVTAMAARLLVDAGLDPTVVCGAVPIGCRSGGRAGYGPRMLAEACEYRANFLHLRPRHAVILGIEPDHFDYYRSEDELEHAFSRFARSVPSDGLLLAHHDCPATSRATFDAVCPVETFGVAPQADWSARQVSSQGGNYAFTLFQQGLAVCQVRLGVPGRHNLLNAMAAAALAWHQGVAPKVIAAGLSAFAGLRRRLERLPPWSGVLRVDDYAHHPTEVSASLEAVRQMHPGRRVWCVFQPHQASRTEHLLDELAQSLQNADKVLVAEIFRAREPGPRQGEVTAADLAERARALGADASHLPGRHRILRRLKTNLRPGDVLITMGAGDIGRIQDDFVLVEGVRKNRQAG